MFQKIVNNALTGNGCSAAEAITLLESSESDLFQAATQIRETHFQNSVKICSIINAKSGKCDMDCRFCSQSGHNDTPIEVYPFLDNATLEQEIHRAIDGGDRHCGIVTSGGKLSSDELEEFATTVEKIGGGKRTPICGSLGRLLPEDLKRLKDAGVSRFHHNLEASESYYPTVCSTQAWSDRLQTVRAAQAAGLAAFSRGPFRPRATLPGPLRPPPPLPRLRGGSRPPTLLHSP